MPKDDSDLTQGAAKRQKGESGSPVASEHSSDADVIEEKDFPFCGAMRKDFLEECKDITKAKVFCSKLEKRHKELPGGSKKNLYGFDLLYDEETGILATFTSRNKTSRKQKIEYYETQILNPLFKDKIALKQTQGRYHGEDKKEYALIFCGKKEDKKRFYEFVKNEIPAASVEEFVIQRLERITHENPKKYAKEILAASFKKYFDATHAHVSRSFKDEMYLSRLYFVPELNMCFMISQYNVANTVVERCQSEIDKKFKGQIKITSFKHLIKIEKGRFALLFIEIPTSQKIEFTAWLDEKNGNKKTISKASDVKIESSAGSSSNASQIKSTGSDEKIESSVQQKTLPVASKPGVRRIPKKGEKKQQPLVQPSSNAPVVSVATAVKAEEEVNEVPSLNMGKPKDFLLEKFSEKKHKDPKNAVDESFEIAMKKFNEFRKRDKMNHPDFIFGRVHYIPELDAYICFISEGARQSTFENMKARLTNKFPNKFQLESPSVRYAHSDSKKYALVYIKVNKEIKNEFSDWITEIVNSEKPAISGVEEKSSALSASVGMAHLLGLHNQDVNKTKEFFSELEKCSTYLNWGMFVPFLQQNKLGETVYYAVYKGASEKNEASSFCRRTLGKKLKASTEILSPSRFNCFFKESSGEEVMSPIPIIGPDKKQYWLISYAVSAENRHIIDKLIETSRKDMQERSVSMQEKVAKALFNNSDSKKKSSSRLGSGSKMEVDNASKEQSKEKESADSDEEFFAKRKLGKRKRLIRCSDSEAEDSIASGIKAEEKSNILETDMDEGAHFDVANDSENNDSDDEFKVSDSESEIEDMDTSASASGITVPAAAAIAASSALHLEAVSTPARAAVSPVQLPLAPAFFKGTPSPKPVNVEKDLRAPVVSAMQTEESNKPITSSSESSNEVEDLFALADVEMEAESVRSKLG